MKKSFFVSKRMKKWRRNLEGLNVSLFWQFLAIFYYFYFSVKWNLRRVTLIWRKIKQTISFYFDQWNCLFCLTFTNLNACKENEMQQCFCYECLQRLKVNTRFPFSPKWHSAPFMYYNQLYEKQFKSFFLFITRTLSTGF